MKGIFVPDEVFLRYIMALFSNQATLTYNGNTTNSNVVYGEILDARTVEKTAVEDSYVPDGLVTYAITFRNTGGALNGLTVTDDLGAYPFGTGTLVPLTYESGSAILFVDGVQVAAPTVVAGPPLVFNGINLPAGASAVLIYQARANEFASPMADGVINNTVNVSGGGLTTPVVATESTPARVLPLLSIFKSITPSQVLDNETITYTFIIQNNGNEPIIATDDAIVTDTFNPILENLVVTYNGTTWTEGTEYTYDETTGLFSTLPGALVIPAATYTQDAQTGAYVVAPGVVTLTVSGVV